MKSKTKSEKETEAEAAGNRPVGSAAEKLPKKKKKLLNLEEESRHSSGHDKLAVEKAARRTS